uniref:Uncharacterized protein n=1 Tax=Lactuca sativa TaxID=4236 RepID=A0A9R1WF64_LACSA|nr:hypothetical protein LSAT_V11C200059700 [Lactuca sativa]
MMKKNLSCMFHFVNNGGYCSFGGWNTTEPWSQYQRYDVDNGGGHGRFFPAIDEWYFPHEFLNPFYDLDDGAFLWMGCHHFL